MHRRLKNLSLSKKFILPMIGVVILVMGTTGSWLLDTMYRSIVALETQGRESLLAEKSVIVDTVESSLKAKADILGRFLAKIAPDFILSYDYTSITSFIDMATKDSDVIHVAFLNPQGEKLVGDSMAEKRPGHRFYDFPIEYDGELLGSIRIIMSTQNLDATVQASEGRFNQTIGNFKKEAVTNRKAVFRFMVGGIFAVVLGLSIVQLFLFRRVVKVPLLETHDRLQEIARGDGDLTKRVPADSHDEIGQVGKTFNLFVHTLQQMISHVQINADAVMKESQALERLATGMSDSAKIQVDKTLDVRTGIDQIAVTITEVAGSASNVVSYASELDEKATQGAAIVQESVDKMDRIASSVESIARTIDILGQSSEEIQGVVDVINDIADQTNLLSLNASIEAARAGEHGRGFSVVAGEVGKLSERTGNATKEIGDLIRRIQTDIRESVSSTMEGRENVQSGVDCIQEAGLALGHIKSSVSNLSERIKKIAASTEEQSACSEMANTHVGEIADEAEAMNKHAKESLMLGKKVSELSGELNDLVSRFKCLSAES